MKVVILGSGVIGVTSAYYLARAGADVTVVDRQPGPAQETSQANAGQISYGYSAPWAAPGIPLKALKWLFQREAPLAVRPDGSWWQIEWTARMLRNCTAARYAQNKARLVRLAEYSRTSLAELRAATGIDYEGRSRGTIQLFRSAAQVDAASRDLRVLDQYGVPYEMLDAAGCVRAEPGLAAAAGKLAGGLRLSADETGDCRMFTEALAAEAARLGVKFLYGATVAALEGDARTITGVKLQCGVTLHADQYVVAMGSYSRELAGRLGISLPVYPVKGYSLTVPITHGDVAPTSTVIDETWKIAITRFANRIRVGGMAELSGFNLKLNPRRRHTLERVLDDLFPDAGDLGQGVFWTGLRPMTPDGTPLIGRAGPANLWLNTGHGTLGWTLSCGSGRLLADLVAHGRAEIRSDDLGLDRYRSDFAVRPALGAVIGAH